MPIIIRIHPFALFLAAVWELDIENESKYDAQGWTWRVLRCSLDDGLSNARPNAVCKSVMSILALGVTRSADKNQKGSPTVQPLTSVFPGWYLDSLVAWSGIVVIPR